jgi:tetratricopeptide (TPR) repeat protein
LTAQEWFEKAWNAAHLDKVDLDEVIRCYTETIRLKPDFAEAYHNRANARVRKGDLDGALADYTEAIRLKPDYAVAYYNRGLARGDKGDRDGALADYTIRLAGGPWPHRNSLPGHAAHCTALEPRAYLSAGSQWKELKSQTAPASGARYCAGSLTPFRFRVSANPQDHRSGQVPMA